MALHNSHPAAALAAALAQCPEAVCRRYLPHGRRQGRYWVAGDLHGAKGRSLFVRLRPPGPPGRWTDAATGEHGDLLDLIRHRIGAGTLRPALDEARAFLALPVVQRRDPEAVRTHPPAAWNGTAAARRLWRRCRIIDGTHAERYLRARGLDARRLPSLRFHPALAYQDESGRRRPFPALVAAVSGPDGALEGVQRTWLDPSRPAKAPVAQPRKALGRVHGHAVRLTMPSDDSPTLLVGEGIETVLSLLAAVPALPAAAALSAGSLAAFAPPPGTARLLIAADRDPAGLRAAATLEARALAQGIAATVLTPEHGDFNDDLAALGPQALAARLGHGMM